MTALVVVVSAILIFRRQTAELRVALIPSHMLNVARYLRGDQLPNLEDK